MLILDDSTSSVDAKTESQIQAALDEVMKGRTTFIIAHRISSVRRADQILLLEDGEIVERGTHRELLDKKGHYQEVYRLQLPAQDEALTRTWLTDDGG